MKQLAIFDSDRSASHEHQLATNRPRAQREAGRTNHIAGTSPVVEALLTRQEAAGLLKIHPKVLERMAKRGEVPALKVGKFWRYRVSALDVWINSRLQSGSQACRRATSF